MLFMRGIHISRMLLGLGMNKPAKGKMVKILLRCIKRPRTLHEVTLPWHKLSDDATCQPKRTLPWHKLSGDATLPAQTPLLGFEA
jgi:hypothetical protein